MKGKAWCHTTRMRLWYLLITLTQQADGNRSYSHQQLSESYVVSCSIGEVKGKQNRSTIGFLRYFNECAAEK